MPELELGFYDALSILSYGLIAVSYAMRDMRWLRIITVVACLLDVVIYYFIRPGQPLWIHVVMNFLFIAINCYQLLMLHRDGRAGGWNREAAWLYETVFPLLTPGEFRKLLAAGHWSTAPDGDVLLKKGQTAAKVTVLIDGHLDLYWDGEQRFERVPRGAIVGEMSFLSGRPASADVRAGGEARLFTMAHDKLRQFLRERPELFAKLGYIFAQQVVDKLVVANDRTLFSH